MLAGCGASGLANIAFFYHRFCKFSLSDPKAELNLQIKRTSCGISVNLNRNDGVVSRFGLHKPRTHRSAKEAGQDPRPFLARAVGAGHKELALPQPVLPRTLHRPIACHKAGSGYEQLGRTWKVRFWFHPLKVVLHAEKVAEVVKCGLACTQSLFASLVCPNSQYDTPKRRKLSSLEKVPSFASDVSSDAGEFHMNIYIFSVNSSYLNWCC